MLPFNGVVALSVGEKGDRCSLQLSFPPAEHCVHEWWSAKRCQVNMVELIFNESGGSLVAPLSLCLVAELVSDV